jgi:saccharopine dehydrogenase (NAD+, L-lysine-forming)
LALTTHERFFRAKRVCVRIVCIDGALTMALRPVFILGGSGSAGIAIARLILERTTYPVILAGRNIQRLEAAAHALNAEFLIDRVRAHRVDARDSDALTRALSGCKIVVVAAPLTAHAVSVARAALRAKVDYVDLYVPWSGGGRLDELAAEILQARRVFLTQAGSHPGMIAPLARYVAGQLDTAHRVGVAMYMNLAMDWTDTGVEFIHQLMDYDSRVFANGEWRPAESHDYRRIDFGEPYGIHTSVPFVVDELVDVPSELGLDRAGAYVAGFNWFVNYIVMPIGLLLSKTRRRYGAQTLARLLYWGLRTFSREPFGMVVLARAEGTKDGAPMSFSLRTVHRDPYVMTAAPVVAAILQYLDGAIPPGLHLAGRAVDPSRFVRSLGHLGIAIEEKAK